MRQAAVSDPPTKPRKSRHTFNTAKAIRQAQRGLNAEEIARFHHVDRTTVWRFLEEYKLNQPRLELWKQQRADVLAGLQADAVGLQKRLLESFNDAVVSTLKPHEKTSLIMATNALAGTAFDKERLERGQSTANHSILTQVLNGAVKDVYTQPVVVEAKNAELEHVSAEQTTEQQSRASSGPTTDSEGA